MAETESTKVKLGKKQWAKIITASFLVLLANLLFFLMLWIIDRYDDVQFDQILYQIKSPVAGTNDGLIGSAMIRVVLVGSLVAAVEIFIYLILTGKFKEKFAKFKKYVAYSVSRTAAFFKKRFMPIAASVLVCSVAIFIFGLNVHIFIANALTPSDFIEKHYVDPEKANITFPEQKRNLIYIVLESMETTYSDTSVGGNITTDFVPELTELAKNNISFTGSDGNKGAYSYIGTRWTAAAMLSLKFP